MHGVQVSVNDCPCSNLLTCFLLNEDGGSDCSHTLQVNSAISSSQQWGKVTFCVGTVAEAAHSVEISPISISPATALKKMPNYALIGALFMASLSLAAGDYVAAVAEHTVFMGSETDSNAHKLSVNLDIYTNLTRLAKANGAQILVFPEFGLISSSFDERADLYPFAEKIGALQSPPAVPCDDTYYQDKTIMMRMSCAAKESQLALLVNTVDWIDCNGATDANCPSDGHYQYNTDVIFNEHGEFVTKYYKSHEFPSLQKSYDEVPQPSQVTYKSSFGVEFGVFTCYDIMFADPAKVMRANGIEHFLYPVQQGKAGESAIIEPWSRNNDAVVLSANLGSGKGDCSGIINRGTALPAKKVHLTGAFPDENVLVATVPAANK